MSSTEISGISTLSYLREKCKPFDSLCLGSLLKNDSMLAFAVRLVVFCLSCKIFSKKKKLKVGYFPSNSFDVELYAI